MFEENVVIEIPEEEWRRIEISILDENGDVVFDINGNVTRRTAHKFMENVGYAFVPQDTTPLAFPRVSSTAIGKISCEHTRNCTDYPKKCSECAGNIAMSYFISKEECLPAYPAIIGSDLERADDANYFYYKPGTDASLVVQAAVDYLKAKMEEVER